jgi:hypothetical protein
VRQTTGFGLRIASDCAIPGTFDDPGGSSWETDITVETLAPVQADQEARPIYNWDGETLVFSPPGVGRYYCRRDSIGIAAEHGADPQMVVDLLVATALPAVLWLRGDAVLHATAILSGAGTAIAIAGPSGIGKSTVVAQLIETGAELLADDTVRLARVGPHIRANGLSAGYHLSSTGDSDRAFHPVAHCDLLADIPVRAIVFLTRTKATPALIRLDPLDALTRLLANQHRPAIPAILGRRGDVLELMTFVAQNCEMYEWRRSSPTLGSAELAMLRHAGLIDWGD